jgi:hypothetical protein
MQIPVRSYQDTVLKLSFLRRSLCRSSIRGYAESKKFNRGRSDNEIQINNGLQQSQLIDKRELTMGVNSKQNYHNKSGS